MKRTMIILLLTALSFPAASQQKDSLLVMFWNLENFFDIRPHEGHCRDSLPSAGSATGATDADFTPEGSRHWTPKRYRTKCNAVAKIIFLASDRFGRLPDVIGFVEVENRRVLEDLVLDTPLRKLGYRSVHFDSPDRRGIDCGLLYRKSSLNMTGSAPLHIYNADGKIMPTRDILLACFDSLSVLVNHHPSKVGQDSQEKRRIAMGRMRTACDSLQESGVRRILCIGDFNDNVWKTCDFPPGYTLKTSSGRSPLGTIKYEGEWEKIDGCFFEGFSKVEEYILDEPSLLTGDSAYGGLKPRRTYSGPRWLGGVSDHLPIVIKIFY